MGTVHCKNILAGKMPEIAIVAVADRSETRRTWADENLNMSIKKLPEK
jgi:hypothetical protein